MTDWNNKEEFLRAYYLGGAAKLAAEFGVTKQKIYNRVSYFSYKAQHSNERKVPLERQFPYSKYLCLLLEAIRKHAEAHNLVPKCRSNALFTSWLRSYAGQRLLRDFALATEGSEWNTGEYELGEGM